MVDRLYGKIGISIPDEFKYWGIEIKIGLLHYKYTHVKLRMVDLKLMISLLPMENANKI